MWRHGSPDRRFSSAHAQSRQPITAKPCHAESAIGVCCRFRTRLPGAHRNRCHQLPGDPEERACRRPIWPKLSLDATTRAPTTGSPAPSIIRPLIGTSSGARRSVRSSATGTFRARRVGHPLPDRSISRRRRHDFREPPRVNASAVYELSPQDCRAEVPVERRLFPALAGELRRRKIKVYRCPSLRFPLRIEHFARKSHTITVLGLRHGSRLLLLGLIYWSRGENRRASRIRSTSARLVWMRIPGKLTQVTAARPMARRNMYSETRPRPWRDELFAPARGPTRSVRPRSSLYWPRRAPPGPSPLDTPQAPK